MLHLSIMTDFIEIYPNVLSSEFCQNFTRKFEQCTYKSEGRTGGGVDKSKKNSHDITLNRHSEFQQELQTISAVCAQQVTAYVRKYFFSLI